MQVVVSNSELASLLREIEEECAERRGDIPATPIRSNYLFEGQLSGNEESAAQDGRQASVPEGQEGFREALQQATARIAEAVTAARENRDNADVPDAGKALVKPMQ